MPNIINYEIHVNTPNTRVKHTDPMEIDCLRPSKALAVSVLKDYEQAYKKELIKKLFDCKDVAGAFAQLHNIAVNQKSLYLYTQAIGRNSCICKIIKEILTENAQLIGTIASYMHPVVHDPVIARGKTIKLSPCVEDLSTLELIFEESEQ